MGQSQSDHSGSSYNNNSNSSSYNHRRDTRRSHSSDREKKNNQHRKRQPTVAVIDDSQTHSNSLSKSRRRRRRSTERTSASTTVSDNHSFGGSISDGKTKQSRAQVASDTQNGESTRDTTLQGPSIDISRKRNSETVKIGGDSVGNTSTRSRGSRGSRFVATDGSTSSAGSFSELEQQSLGSRIEDETAYEDYYETYTHDEEDNEDKNHFQYDDEDDAMITYYYQRQRELQMRQQHVDDVEPPTRQLRNANEQPTAALNGNVTDHLSSGLKTSSNNSIYLNRRNSVESTGTESFMSALCDSEQDDFSTEFYPPISQNYEWMGRSIESLFLGHVARAPLLQLIDDDILNGSPELMGIDGDFYRRRSTASTFGGGGRRQSTASSFYGIRRGSLTLSGYVHGNMQGGTLANYYNSSIRRGRSVRLANEVDRSNSVSGATMTIAHGPSEDQRRGSLMSNGPMGRRRSSMASSAVHYGFVGDTHTTKRGGGGTSGPNVALRLLARELTGRSCLRRGIPETQRLRKMGGSTLFNIIDKPAVGIASEVASLASAIDCGDWTETHSIISRLVARLIGDPTSFSLSTDGRRRVIDDPSLPPTASRFYAGGGRLGLERDAFVMAGGVQVTLRLFREKSFVGQEMANTYDARDLSQEIVTTRLASCWNEALGMLRELVYAIPSLVDDGSIYDDGDFLPFLFTLLSHDSCFDSAVSLIEEILSFMVQSHNQPSSHEIDGTVEYDAENPLSSHLLGRASTASMFFLGNVPNLYKLWRGFNCRQLAHFCRILALLVFEPEDRQLLESPAVLKSLELLYLRRNRAARAGRDSTVDMNQAIVLGDGELIKRLLKLISILNFAPPIRRFSTYHVLAQFPFIADTLVMLGLHELVSWDEVERQERLARLLLEEDDEDSDILLSDLGTVADLLERLSSTLSAFSRQNQNQIGHMIHVITAAQQAGVIVGRNQRRSRRQRRRHSASGEIAASLADSTFDGISMQGLASITGILTDQIIVHRLNQGSSSEEQNNSAPNRNVANDSRRLRDHEVVGPHIGNRYFINTPEDAANSLQFNAMLLGPYQVEVLFVLCTLLGGRRKLDAQDLLREFGIVSVLDSMFHRLPWYKHESQQDQNESFDQRTIDETEQGSQPNGIHGPGCECTPESALCVQYLRMLHNFCDRDCDNYEGRRLLLSESERDIIFQHSSDSTRTVKPGLLSKIIHSFIHESDESPYRFWLASCIESYLRGSSPAEQMFVAQSGLLTHLIDDISSDRLHCAGSLQTSFDLLGELGKGTADVVFLLVEKLNEENFRKLMSVAAANLVDSNVFIRSLLLSLERMTTANGLLPQYLDHSTATVPLLCWDSPKGNETRSYLTHSWWDISTLSLFNDECGNYLYNDNNFNEDRPSDWFPPQELLALKFPEFEELATFPKGLNESVGHFGWVFTPVGKSLTEGSFLPNTVDRMSWFLAANQARLLRDLLRVVDLRNINHENICCLNTAVVIAIFAHRRKQLALLLQELRSMNDEEIETKRRAMSAARRHEDVVDRAFVQAMRYLDLDHQSTPYTRRATLLSSINSNGNGGVEGSGFSQHSYIEDRTDVMRNFREVLWFWMEYYTHRGRDRLSLEFSSHIRFHEWNHVVSLLAADDGSPTSLVRAPLRLPHSPYQRAARVIDNPIRGE